MRTPWIHSSLGIVLALACAVFCFPVRSQGDSGDSGEVFVLPVQGPIDKSMLYIFRRAFREVERRDPAAIIVDLDTPGGRLQETEEIIEWLRSCKSERPVYAFVNDRAFSAGAIISLGTDAIYISRGGVIGDAMPIMVSPFGGGVQETPDDYKEKIRSAVRAMVRALAQQNGYSAELAEAMVDPEREFKIGDRMVCAKGELLTLTSKEAVEIIPPETEPVLARAIVPDIPSLLEHVGMADAEIVRFEEESAERLARFITMIGPVLFSLAIMAIAIEFKTPGFGIPGMIGISLLMVFFFGHYVAGFAGMEDIALVVTGIVLVMLEVFVIPGFGIAGILGVACIVGGLILAMIPFLPSGVEPLPGFPAGKEMVPLGEYYMQAAMRNLLITIASTMAGFWALSKILPKTPVYGRFVLETALSQETGYVSSDAGNTELMGREGVAMTQLRPSGTAVIGEQRVDVVSSGDLVPANTRIRVIEVHGGRIVVEEITDIDEEAEPDSEAV